MSNLSSKTQQTFVQKVSQCFKNDGSSLKQASQTLSSETLKLDSALFKHSDLADIRKTYVNLLWRSRDVAGAWESELTDWVDNMLMFLMDSSAGIAEKKGHLPKYLKQIKTKISRNQDALQTLQDLKRDLEAKRGDVDGLDDIDTDIKTAYSNLFDDPLVACPGEVGIVFKALLQARPYFTDFVSNVLKKSVESLDEENAPDMSRIFKLEEDKSTLLGEAGAANLAAAIARGLDALDGLIFICSVGNILQSIVEAIIADLDQNGEIPAWLDKDGSILKGISTLLKEYTIMVVLPSK